MSDFEVQEPQFKQEIEAEQGFNLSALAVREKSVTFFFLLAVIVAGTIAYLQLGRAEDPTFTIKVFTVTAAWPGATAQEMQDLVAEPLEKRMQELKYYYHVDTFTRPGLTFLTVTLQDYTPPEELQEEFYQGRKKIQDEAPKLPKGVFPPVVNDEYTDVIFSVYALKARDLSAASSHQRSGVTSPRAVARAWGQESEHSWGAPGADFCRVLLRPHRDAGHQARGRLRSSGAAERGDARRINRYAKPASLHPIGRRAG